MAKLMENETKLSGIHYFVNLKGERLTKSSLMSTGLATHTHMHMCVPRVS
jgi:hypothetical protein